MEPTKILASGLTLEESKAKRQEKQAARYRHRLGTYVPSGDSKGLLEALMATSPSESSTSKKSIASGSTKPRKSVKSSTKAKSNDETADESTQEAEQQVKAKKSIGRKLTKAVDSGEKSSQVEQSGKKASRSVSKVRGSGVEGEGENGLKPSTSRQAKKTASTVKSKATKSSKKPTATKKPKLSKASSHNTEGEDDFDSQLITPETAQHKLGKSSAKPPPAQTDDESDDLAIKKTVAPGRVDKGKAREIGSPPETFESAGTDVDLEDSRPRPSNTKPLSAEEKSLRDAPPDVYPKITTPIISRVAPNQRDSSEEEQEKKPPQKKRGRPRKGEGGEPPPKRGRMLKVDDADEDSSKSNPRRQIKKPPSKPRSKTTKGRARKKTGPSPDTGDEGRERGTLPETKASASNTRKRQQRALDDGSDDEELDEPDSNESGSYPNRVRLDSIPPEGVIIRKKNGIVEKLLPPVVKPKRRAPGNRGKTRGSRKRAIPAHVLKYIGPTRFGSPLKAVGTDTDDDLNL